MWTCEKRETIALGYLLFLYFFPSLVMHKRKDPDMMLLYENGIGEKGLGHMIDTSKGWLY